MRQQPDLAALEPVEKHLIAALDQVAPELDKAAVGAAWMILAEGLAQLANDAPQHFTARVLVNVSQLAGQHLYAGAATGMQVRCPVVRSAGSQCPFVAKGATEDRMDAMMQTHYATYHPGQTWPLEVVSDSAHPDWNSGLGELYEVVGGAGAERERPTVTVHAVDAKGDRIPAEGTVSEQPTPQSVRAINDLRRAYRLPEIVLPEGVFPEQVDQLLRASLVEAERERERGSAEWLKPFTEPGSIAPCVRCANPVFVYDDGSTDGGVHTLLGILCDKCLCIPAEYAEARAEEAELGEREPVELPTHAIGRCKVCSRPVGIDEGSGLPAGYVTVRGVMCREHRDEAYPSDAVPAAAGVMATEALVDGGIRYESAKCPECRFLIYLKDGVFVSHTRGGSFFECAGSGRRPA